jgi:plastocyanin
MEPFTRTGTYLGALATAVAGAAASACADPSAGPGTPPQAEHQMSMPAPAAAASVQTVAVSAVAISGFAYVPAAITVPAGTTVTWRNDDSARHDVSGGPLRSPLLSQGATWSYTFATPGTYSYICSVHPNMKGTVTVR